MEQTILRVRRGRFFCGALCAAYLFLFSHNSAGATVTVMAPRHCKEWNENRSRQHRLSNYERLDRSFDETWLLGLMTGLNGAMATDVDALGVADAQTVIDWMDAFCSDQPESTVFDGAQKLLLKLEAVARKGRK